jgi:uncharacterized protein (TIGR00255 family)
MPGRNLSSQGLKVVNSMTGFGRGEHSDNGLHATVEIRSVNHRFREIAVRIPRAYLLMEEKIKNQIEGQVARGHLDVFVNIEDQREKKRNVKLDKELVLAYDKCPFPLGLFCEHSFPAQ